MFLKFSLFFLLFWIPCFAFEPEFSDAKVCRLNDGRYYPFVLEAIEEAKSSVNVLLYLASCGYAENDKTEALLKALIKAHQRGVKVSVILEGKGGGRGSPFSGGGVAPENREAFLKLRKEGVSAVYDDLSKLNHGKAVIIDEELVILGSANWSRAAFESNTETNAAIRSRVFALEMLEDFKALKTSQPVRAQGDVKGLCLKTNFIEKNGSGPRLVSSKNKRAFDLYLYLLWRYEANPEARLEVPYKDIARALDMGGMTPEQYRRQINKVLKAMNRKFRLLSFEPSFKAENVIVKLLDDKDGLKPYTLPEKGEEGMVIVPEMFFTLGWQNRLSLRAEFCYLIHLLEARRSADGEAWSAAREELEKRYGIGKDVISDGMMELRRQNLIDILYTAPSEEEYSFSFPNTYLVLPLPNPQEREKDFAELEKKYGNEKVLKVRKFLEIVFKENDPEALREILKALETCGEKVVEEAFDIVARKSISNPKRDLSYVKGILAKGAGEE